MSKQLILASLIVAGMTLCGLPKIVTAKPSLGGHGGGGGARPAMGGGARPAVSRPSMPASRPANMSKPSFSNVQRPSAPNISKPATRPAVTSPPSLGGFPSANNRPAFTKPGTGVSVKPNSPSPANPGGTNRPAVTLPGNLPSVNKPAVRPAVPPSKLPGTLPGNKLPGSNRPGVELPSLNRPGISLPDRPTTLPLPNRPGNGGGDRPNLGNNRPERPIIGGGNGNGNIVIGGGNTIIGGGNHHGNNSFNRPVTLPGQHPNWGLGNNHDWHDHWHNNGIHNHYHGWYHGCWHGGNYWYAPLAIGTTYWGLNAINHWGYGPTYYNPYYVTSAAPAYDYSQPIVINNNIASSPDAAPTPETTTQAAAAEEAGKLVDEALVLFKTGDYASATARCETALRKSPGDPVPHELRALCLFAQGNYASAAATLNSLLATAPGMDWTTMSSLYTDTETYTKQLRTLEAHCKANPADAAANFVLAYHYQVLNEGKAAANALRAVLKQQPQDAVAQRLLDSVAEPANPAAAESPSTNEGNDAQPEPQTDLVGKWQALADKTQIELRIDEKSQFTWKATPQGKAAIELAGEVSTSEDSLILESKEQGKMAGSVASGGADKFTFKLAGAPSTDPGLAFIRVK